jgi:hypothetical protein
VCRFAGSPGNRAIPQGFQWNISCQVRSCKKKCRGPTACTKTPWPAEKIAAKFLSWIECTTCSNDLPGGGRRNQLLGGWFCGKGNWDERHSTEAKARAVTPIPGGLVLTGRNGIAMRNVTAFAQRGFLAGVGRASMGGSGASSNSARSGSASESSSASALADMKRRLRGACGVSSLLATATSSAARRSELLRAAATTEPQLQQYRDLSAQQKATLGHRGHGKNW